jgi:hypothetical protein
MKNNMPMPPEPKIYYIVHADRLSPIIADGWLWCDAEVVRRSLPGTTIGMNATEQRRLTGLRSSRSGSYAAACKRNDVQLGRMFVFETGRLTNPSYVINFPTRRHWRDKSGMEDIEVGLAALAEEIRSRNIRSIAIPALGCGLGGLDWSEVRRRIEATLGELSDVKIVVFEPDTPIWAMLPTKN